MTQLDFRIYKISELQGYAGFVGDEEFVAKGTYDTLQQRSVVPEGWKLVPVEPTVDMRRAFHQADEQANDGYHDVESPDHQWQAMLTVAPDAGEIAE